MFKSVNISRRLLSLQQKKQQSSKEKEEGREYQIREAAAMFLNNVKLQPCAPTPPSLMVPHMSYFDKPTPQHSVSSFGSQSPGMSSGSRSPLSSPESGSPKVEHVQHSFGITHEANEADELQDQVYDLPYFDSREPSLTSSSSISQESLPCDVKFHQHVTTFDKGSFTDEYILDMIVKEDKLSLSGKTDDSSARHPLKPPPALEPNEVDEQKNSKWRRQLCKLERREVQSLIVSHGSLVMEQRKAFWRDIKTGKVLHHESLQIPSGKDLFKCFLAKSDASTHKESKSNPQRSRYHLPSFDTTIRCQPCNGLGIKECTSCLNQPAVPCFWCSSTGKKGGKTNNTSSDCKRCFGRGQFSCRRCHDNGQVTCAMCAQGHIQAGLFIDVTLYTVDIPMRDCTRMTDGEIASEFRTLVAKIDEASVQQSQPVVIRSARCIIEYTQKMDVVLYSPKAAKRLHQMHSALNVPKWTQTTYSVTASKRAKVERKYSSLASYDVSRNLSKVSVY